MGMFMVITTRGPEWVEARDAVPHPTVSRTPLKIKNFPGSNVNTAKVETLAHGTNDVYICRGTTGKAGTITQLMGLLSGQAGLEEKREGK
jgi:hypothetical protein